MKRTGLQPHGRRWRCHVCGHSVILVPSYFGDDTCSRCGSLLWPRPPGSQPALQLQRRLHAAGARFGIDLENKAWRIDLSRGAFQDADLAEFTLLGPVTELYLTDSSVSDRGVGHLAQLTSLEVLELTNTRISDRSLEQINRLIHLEVLALDETGVTDDALVLLNPLHRLWCLDLDHTKIKGESFAELHFLKQLESLSLSHTPVDDRALKCLSKTTRLE